MVYKLHDQPWVFRWRNSGPEWVRRYTLLTELQYSPPRRARIRECMAQDRFLVFIPLFLRVLNALLHASIYPFLCGLNFLTITGDPPILSMSLMAVSTVAPRGLRVPPFSPPGTDSPLTGLPIQLREVEKDVPTRTLTLDTGAMSWLLHSLTREQELERFLTGIPSFYKSTWVSSDGRIPTNFPRQSWLS
ncbi:hypothetical protein EDB85DRAFT_1944988 [Lactarius pseudohatsudake]|nr:hypothetical protein EDB85DRAFT_1944988 [Lactarius pseudohatsudake]